jgi:uncharacterized protein YecA (UPF0149 family)
LCSLRLDVSRGRRGRPPGFSSTAGIERRFELDFYREDVVVKLGPQVAEAAAEQFKSERENIGRNDPCWCGSGKKFKKCHGA